MAVLDPRLLPLLATLAGAGADWLAFEIVEGVRRGREPVEPEEGLRAARDKVRSRQFPDRVAVETQVMAEPIVSDDQIIWAANYVSARLDGILADLYEGFAMIEAVADESGGAFKVDDRPFAKGRPALPVEIMLVGQEGPPVNRASLTIARARVNSLREALAVWAFEAQGGTEL